MQVRIKQFALGAMAVLLSAGLTAPTHADSLRSAMIDAYSNSPLLEQRRYLLRVEDENVIQAVAQLYPVINFVASTRRDFQVSTTTSTAELVGQLVLYQGGQRRNSIRAAEATVEATRYQLVALEQQVLLDAVVAYLNVWRDMQVVGVSEANVRVITQQLRAARDRFEVGEDTRTDVAQAEAQLALARSNLAASRGSLEISRELFNIAIGRYPNGLAGPGAMPHLPDGEAAAGALARQQHPAIRALQSEVRAAEFAVERARGAGRPTLSGQAAVSQRGINTNPLTQDPSSSVTLQLTVPLYQGGSIASLERQALAQASAVRSALNQQTRVNLQTVGNAYARLRIAGAQIQASDQRIRAAQLAFDGVREEASLGARTTLDVLDAEQDLLDARISRIQAQTDMFIATYSALAASGLLTVEHLNLAVPEYDVAAYSNTFNAGTPRVASPQGERLDSLLQHIGRD